MIKQNRAFATLQLYGVRFFRLLRRRIQNSKYAQPEKSNAVQLERSKGTILFDHVKFSYNPERTLITNFS
jgi:ABC-type transport system involved in Fe-S cluster assembly fused permease/ATPase subunit